MKNRFPMHPRHLNIPHFLPHLKIRDNLSQLLTEPINIPIYFSNNSPLDMMVRVVLDVDGQVARCCALD